MAISTLRQQGVSVPEPIIQSNLLFFVPLAFFSLFPSPLPIFPRLFHFLSLFLFPNLPQAAWVFLFSYLTLVVVVGLYSPFHLLPSHCC